MDFAANRGVVTRSYGECYRTPVLNPRSFEPLTPARSSLAWLFVAALLLGAAFSSSCREQALRRSAVSGNSAEMPAAAMTTSGPPSASPKTSPEPAASIPLALTLSFTFPIDDLSQAQADSIIAGRVTRWSQVGGPDRPLRLLGWTNNQPEQVSSLTIDSPLSRDGAAALLQTVIDQPGDVVLLPWDGPRLRAKALRIDGRAPDEPEYPYQAAPQSVAAPGLLSDAAAARGRFTLSAVGDLMLGRRVAQQALNGGPDYPLALAEPALRKGDFAIGNLEVSLTDRGQATRKDYTFRATPALASGLKYAGIGAVSLANNHVGDYGAAGVLDTLGALDAAGIAHAGAGANSTGAAAATPIIIRGVRVALLSFVNVPTDSVTGFSTSSEAATAGTPGINWGTPEAVGRAVADARGGADVVIVSLHSGTEYADQPDSLQRSLAYAAIDAGAALVLGSHPHVLQGIEYYRDGVILYSLGNFVFDIDGEDVRALGLPAAQTVVAQISFQDGRVRGLELDPMDIDSSTFRPVPAAGAAARSILDRVYRLTEALNPH